MPKYLLTLLLSLGAAGAASANEQITTGYIEKVGLVDAGFEYDAKLDTGADTTSINAEIISLDKAEEGKVQRVKFKLTDKQANQKVLEKEVVRLATIKNRHQGQEIVRPVVNMEFCIAGRLIDGEVNLADRRQFDYQLLIGRNMLIMGNLLVDSEQKNLTQPVCKPMAEERQPLTEEEAPEEDQEPKPDPKVQETKAPAVK